MKPDLLSLYLIKDVYSQSNTIGFFSSLIKLKKTRKIMLKTISLISTLKTTVI